MQFVFQQEGTLSLCLCDTNAQDDVHINDELVAEDYAIFCPDNSPAPLSPAGQVLQFSLFHIAVCKTSLSTP